jgi:hypothetical protein
MLTVAEVAPSRPPLPSLTGRYRKFSHRCRCYPSEAQATGHISAWDEAFLCNGLAYPWASASAFGTSCKTLP